VNHCNHKIHALSQLCLLTAWQVIVWSKYWVTNTKYQIDHQNAGIGLFFSWDVKYSSERIFTNCQIFEYYFMNVILYYIEEIHHLLHNPDLYVIMTFHKHLIEISSTSHEHLMNISLSSYMLFVQKRELSYPQSHSISPHSSNYWRYCIKYFLTTDDSIYRLFCYSYPFTWAKSFQSDIGHLKSHNISSCNCFQRMCCSRTRSWLCSEGSEGSELDQNLIILAKLMNVLVELFWTKILWVFNRSQRSE
jgi:hypothetical protein